MMRRHSVASSSSSSAAIVCNMIRLPVTRTCAAPAAAARARSTTSITRRFYITRQFAVASISSFSTPPLRFSSPSWSVLVLFLPVAVVLLSFRLPPLCQPYHSLLLLASNSIN